MLKRHSDITALWYSDTRTVYLKSNWHQRDFTQLGESRKLRPLYLQTLGRRIGVELQTEPATAKISVSFRQTLGT